MKHELTAAYKMHNQILVLQNELRETINANRLNNMAKIALTASTFLIYIAFTSVIYAGVSIFGIQDYLNGGKLNTIGVLFAILIVFIMPVGLSLVKHVNYDTIAKSQNATRLIASFMVTLAILSGVSYEAISASSNMQEKINRTVSTSEVGQAILNTGSNISNSSVYASMIAEAEFKLVACQRKMADGIYKDCNNSQAKLDSLKAQADAERDNARQASVDAIAAKQAAIEKERDANVIYAGQVIGKWFGVDAKTGLLILLIFVAVLFEAIHATVIINEMANHQQRKLLGDAIINSRERYFEETGKKHNPQDFTDKSVIDLDEMRDVPENEMGGSDGGYKSSSPGFGFVPNKAGLNNGHYWDTDLPKPELRPNVAQNRPTLFKYQEPAATQPARKQPAEFIRTTGKPEPKPNGTGRHNPALGTAEEHYELPIASSAPPVQTGTEKPVQEPGIPGQKTGLGTGYTRSDTGTDKPVQTGQQTTDENLLEALQQLKSEAGKKAMTAAVDLYPEWKKRVLAKEMKPTKRPCQKFIWKETTTEDGKRKAVHADETLKIWNVWILRGIKEGFIQPEFCLSR